MPFEFSDLNFQFQAQQDYQFGPCPNFSQAPCFCTFRPCSLRQSWCPCQTRPYSFCAIPTLTCRCVSRGLTCICLSKPIASVPPKTFDFTIYEQATGVLQQVTDPTDLDVLRTELQEALKQVDVHQEILKQTTGPRSDAELDEAEKALKQQLEQLQQQRKDAKGKK